MSLVHDPSRQDVLDAALVIVAKARGGSSVLNLDVVAKGLLAENPSCSITLDDIKVAMLAFATRNHIAVKVGSPAFVAGDRGQFEDAARRRHP